MKLSKQSFVVVLFTIFILLVTSQVHSSQFKAAGKIQLMLNWKPEPQFGGFYTAQDGIYKEFGLDDVEVIAGGAGTPVVQMVAAKKANFGIASADEVVISRARGSNIVALFAVYQTNPQGIMTHPKRGFKNIAEVFSTEGVLSIQNGLPYSLYLQKKYPNKKVKIVPYAGGIASFLADPQLSQQCFVTSEPLTARKQKIEEKTFLVADEGYNPYTTVVITRRDVITKQPELVKQMVKAIRKGWRQYLDQPEITNKKLALLNSSMDIETHIASALAQKSLIETEETKKYGLGYMSKERWDTLAQQLLDLKLIDKKPDTSTLFESL